MLSLQHNLLFSPSHVMDVFSSPDISKTKPDYLFTYDASKDKSKWLDRQGFRSSDGDRLIKHILEWTNFTNVKYVDINSYNKLKVKALTAFENGVATTIWVINKDYTLTFVTLIPGRSTYDK